MNEQNRISKEPGSPRAKGGRRKVLLVLVLIVLVGAGATLRHQHLKGLAQRVDWQEAGFQVETPWFDRNLLNTENPSEAEVHFRKGMDALQRQKPKIARSEFLKSLAREPEQPMTRFYLGCSQLQNGYPLAALSELKKAAKDGFGIEGHNTSYWLALAYLYNAQREEGRNLLSIVAESQTPQAASAKDILSRLPEGNQP